MVQLPVAEGYVHTGSLETLRFVNGHHFYGVEVRRCFDSPFVFVAVVGFDKVGQGWLGAFGLFYS